MPNYNLTSAKRAKNDEFYYQSQENREKSSGLFERFGKTEKRAYAKEGSNGNFYKKQDLVF